MGNKCHKSTGLIETFRMVPFFTPLKKNSGREAPRKFFSKGVQKGTIRKVSMRPVDLWHLLPILMNIFSF